MKCPLFVMGNIAHPNVLDDVVEECFKEECAWWIPAFECCAVWEMAIRLASTADQLFSIHDDMPHVEQFKR